MKNCAICLEDIKNYSNYCELCKEIYYCKSCIKQMKKNNFFKCPVCMTFQAKHALTFIKKLIIIIGKKYSKCLSKFLSNKEQYGKNRKLYIFNKCVYKNEYVLVLNEFFTCNTEILKIFLMHFKKEETEYKNEIKKSIEYVLSLRI